MKGQKQVIRSVEKEIGLTELTAKANRPTIKYESEVRKYTDMCIGCDWRDYYEASK
jgi:hypothetical protein